MELTEIIHAAIRQSLADPEGAGSDLDRREPIDETWFYVWGNIDTHNLAADIAVAIKRAQR